MRARVGGYGGLFFCGEVGVYVFWAKFIIGYTEIGFFVVFGVFLIS